MLVKDVMSVAISRNSAAISIAEHSGKGGGVRGVPQSSLH